MSLYIKLDGNLFPRDNFTSFDNADITLRREDENGELAYGFSSEITIYGEAYHYVYDKLVLGRYNNISGGFGSNPNGLIVAEIFDDCCKEERDGILQDKLVFIGSIRSDSIDWCINDCSITANLIDRCPAALASNCLQRTRIYSNDYVYPNGKRFQSLNHNFVNYCLEIRPNFLHDVILFFGIVLAPVIYAVLLIIAPLVFILQLVIRTALHIITLISALINVGNTGSALRRFQHLGDMSWAATVLSLANKLNRYLAGCHGGHPAPFVRDYIINVCNICGINFESPILNDPNGLYYNTMMYYAPVAKGTSKYTSWIDENKPLYTGYDFLKFCAEIFNAKFEIRENRTGPPTLVFDRKDRFERNNYILTFSEPNDSRILKLCYKYNTKKIPFFGNYKYTADGGDWVGNEANHFYSDIVEYARPPVDSRDCDEAVEGEYLKTIPIAPARFRGDGVDRDVPGSWAIVAGIMDSMFFPIWASVTLFQVVYSWSSNPLNGIIDDTITSQLMNRPGYPNAFNLLLSMERCTVPKFLIWDNNSPKENAKVIKLKVRDVKTTHYLQNNKANETVRYVESFGTSTPSDYNRQYNAQDDDYIFNYPYFVSAGLKEGGRVASETLRAAYEATRVVKPRIAPEMYDNFFFIDDPELTPIKYVSYTLELSYDCSLLNVIDFDKKILLPDNIEGNIKEVRFNNKTITIIGDASKS